MERTGVRIKAPDSCLLVIDVQERLAPAVVDAAAAVERAVLLVKVADRLGVAVLASEHYPSGLGPVIADLALLIGRERIVEKITFSGLDEPAFCGRLADLDRTQMVICGLEAHVCVLQTALALLARGDEVYVVADAVASRRPLDRDTALERVAAAGGRVVTAEMVVFEWLERGDAPAFRDVLDLVK